MSQFTDRVTLGEDGAYRWRYDLKKNGNSAPMETMVKVCAAIGVPIALIMLAMTWQFDPLQAALIALGFLVLMVGLPALVWKLMPPDPMFKMDETQIQAWPKGKTSGIHRFEGVRDVAFEPDLDRITLRWRVDRLEVYVPSEDYDFVREFIRAHTGY